MVFSVTFNNMSVILWQPVLLVEKTEYPEKTTDLLQATDNLYHKKSTLFKATLPTQLQVKN
jgi:hypothetical protein